MTPSTADITAWTAALTTAARLRDEADHAQLIACCDAVTGQEDAAQLIPALVGAVRGVDDHGCYEAVHTAIWRFPPAQVGAQLGALLPAWLRRLRAAPHQVWRFLAPLQGVGAAALPALRAALEAHPAADRAAVGRAVARLVAELPEAAPLATALGAPAPRAPRAAPLPPAPVGWPAAWVARLDAVRAGALPTDLWVTGAEDELDGVIALLTQPLGAGERHLEAMTNPLYIAFARKHWPLYLVRVAALGPDEKEALMANLRKASRREGPLHDRAAMLQQGLDGAMPLAPGTPPPPPPAVVVDERAAGPSTLRPYIGVGAYRFGMDRAECAAALGPPEAEKRHVGLQQVEERRGPVTAWFADRGLVELHLAAGAALNVGEVDVLSDKQALDKLRAAFPGATEQRAYVNFESLGLCLVGFGKSKTKAGRFAMVYDRGQALGVRFLGKV